MFQFDDPATWLTQLRFLTGAREDPLSQALVTGFIEFWQPVSLETLAVLFLQLNTEWSSEQLPMVEEATANWMSERFVDALALESQDLSSEALPERAVSLHLELVESIVAPALERKDASQRSPYCRDCLLYDLSEVGSFSVNDLAWSPRWFTDARARLGVISLSPVCEAHRGILTSRLDRIRPANGRDSTADPIVYRTMWDVAENLVDTSHKAMASLEAIIATNSLRHFLTPVIVAVAVSQVLPGVIDVTDMTGGSIRNADTQNASINALATDLLERTDTESHKHTVRMRVVRTATAPRAAREVRLGAAARDPRQPLLPNPAVSESPPARTTDIGGGAAVARPPSLMGDPPLRTVEGAASVRPPLLTGSPHSGRTEGAATPRPPNANAAPGDPAGNGRSVGAVRSGRARAYFDISDALVQGAVSFMRTSGSTQCKVEIVGQPFRVRLVEGDLLLEALNGVVTAPLASAIIGQVALGECQTH